jgi:hypothetical protein
MKDNDLYNYFKLKQNSFDEMPNDELWQKIENKIKNKNEFSLSSRKIFLNSLFILSICLFLGLFFFKNLNNNSKKMIESVVKNDSIKKKKDTLIISKNKYIKFQKINEINIIPSVKTDSIKLKKDKKVHSNNEVVVLSKFKVNEKNKKNSISDTLKFSKIENINPKFRTYTIKKIEPTVKNIDSVKILYNNNLGNDFNANILPKLEINDIKLIGNPVIVYGSFALNYKTEEVNYKPEKVNLSNTKNQNLKTIKSNFSSQKTIYKASKELSNEEYKKFIEEIVLKNKDSIGKHLIIKAKGYYTKNIKIYPKLTTKDSIN